MWTFVGTIPNAFSNTCNGTGFMCYTHLSSQQHKSPNSQRAFDQPSFCEMVAQHMNWMCSILLENPGDLTWVVATDTTVDTDTQRE